MRYWKLLGVVGLLALAMVPVTGQLYLIYLGAEILIFSLFALSFNLVLGHAGLISFGHAAYFAVGAYTCAILLTRLEWAFVPSFAGAILVSMFVSLVIGFFCVRLTQVYFAMLTLAFAQLVWAIAFKWDDVTGGDTGLIGVAVPEFIGTPTSFYYFAFGVVIVCGVILWLVVHSAFGRTLAATRENQQRAEFVGINVRLMRLIAFTVSGTFSGIAGALFALFNRSVFSETAWWTQSAEVLIMTILGGVSSFFGPIIGAIVLIGLDWVITDYTEYWPTVLGIILLVVLFFFPQGLVGIARSRARGGSGEDDA